MTYQDRSIRDLSRAIPRILNECGRHIITVSDRCVITNSDAKGQGKTRPLKSWQIPP